MIKPMPPTRRSRFLETRPAQGILLGREDGVLKGLLEAVGLVFLERVNFVEPLDEQQVGELLND